MSAVVDVLVLGFLISALYALVAVGFTMIFGVAGVLNLSHGALAMLGAFVAHWALDAGWARPSAFLAAVVGLAVLAPIIYRVFVRPLQDRPVTVFLATLLLAVLLEQAVILISGPDSRLLPPLIAGNLSVGGMEIKANRLLASAVALGAIAALWAFVTRTRHGKAILALSMERKGAALVGIPAERIVLGVWAISGALAAIAGLFIASFLGISPLEERTLLVIAFSTVVVGGLGSIPGTLGAALIIGYAETIVVQFAPGARGLVPLLLLVAVLVLRPQGLAGRAAE